MNTAAELIWLLAAVAKKDEAAFERLYVATRGKLFGIVLRIVQRQDVAASLIEDAYVTIWQEAERFEPAENSPLIWMATIARAHALKLVRSQTIEPIETEEPPVETPDPAARRDMSEDLRRVLAAVGELDAESQKLVLSAFYNGWSREQLSESFGIGLTETKVRLHQSILQLQTTLGPL